MHRVSIILACRSFPKPHRQALLTFALGIGASFSALADTTTLTLADTTRGSSSSPVTMLFPVTRSGDLGYDAVLSYRTVDGTAMAGTDYAAASGSVVIPAGTAAAGIPVTLLAHPGSGADQSFQLLVDAAGVGPAPAFAAQRSFATGTYPMSVAVADLSGDGKPDLIVANYSSSSISVLTDNTTPGATTPSFIGPKTFAAGAAPQSVTVADLNGDGKLDLAMANPADNTVSVLLNTSAFFTMSFAAAQTFAVGPYPNFIATADVNADGKPDLIVTNGGDGTVSVLLDTTARGATTASFTGQQTFATGPSPHWIAATDLDGDGRPDLAVANFDSNSVSVLLNTTAAGAATPTFAAQESFATGASPVADATADVNGDGKRDLLVVNDDGTISVLLNAIAPGDTVPSFAPQQEFATGINPTSIVAADFNGDGKPDVAVVNFTSTTISMLRNTTAPGAATPSFAAQQTFATGAQPYSIAAADVSGDGKIDLFVTNLVDNSVSVLLNSTSAPGAAPDFGTQQVFATGSVPNSVTTADINGDGKPDLVAANRGGVSVMLNISVPGAATPSFASQEVFAAGGLPQFVAAADINGDGKPDLIVANYDNDNVSVLLDTTPPGANTPTFAVQKTFATGASPASVAATDIDGDGKPDLVVSNVFGDSVSVLRNTTTPGAATPDFAAQQTFAVGSRPCSIATSDINGDGKPDLIVANAFSDNVSVLSNTTAPGGAPSFAAQRTYAVGQFPTAVAVADINGDGKSDLIVANKLDNTLSVLRNTTSLGTPNFAAQQTFSAGNFPISITTADLWGDGKPDVIVANYGYNSVSLLFNSTVPGSTTLSLDRWDLATAGSSSSAVANADVNGDGRPDLIVTHSYDNNVSVLLNTQYQTLMLGNPATGTIVHDYIFANDFE